MNENLKALLSEQPIWFDGAYLSTGLCVFFLVLGVYFLNAMVHEEDRSYMDPLPTGLRIIWPFIRIISFFFCQLLPYEMMERIEKKLQHTGVSYLLTAEQFVACRVISVFSRALCFNGRRT